MNVEKNIGHSSCLLLAIYWLVGIFSYSAAQEIACHPSLSASDPMHYSFPILAESIFPQQLNIEDIVFRIDYERSLCHRAMGKNISRRFSRSPFIIKEICRIGKHLNHWRSVRSKCGNVTYRLNENGVSMKFYLTRYYMKQSSIE